MDNNSGIWLSSGLRVIEYNIGYVPSVYRGRLSVSEGEVKLGQTEDL